jgi:hypothetical protein
MFLCAAPRYWRVAVAITALIASRDLRAQSLSVSGSPGAMVVNSAVAGSAPTAVSDATTTYTIGTKNSKDGITAQLDSAMPTGVTLTATMAACGSGTSYGPIALDNTARDLVHGIKTSGNATCTAAITYQLSATVAAGVVGIQTRTVTLTEIALP